MEYGSEITSREHRMLDKIRQGLGISEARAKELESFVSPQSPSLLPITANGVTFNMVYVEGGTFQMGASNNDSDALNDEKPAHQVSLPSYYIGETEVTQELWQAVMGSNPSHFTGDNRPVENVSWNDCQVFVKKLNAATGKMFRLPTEAEWEFAARGGNKSKGFKFSGSNKLEDVAWYDGNSGSTTHDVKTKNPNELGLYDMSGNVWEWCSDWSANYNGSPQTNPQGLGSGQGRAYRGGGWGNYARSCRSSNRRSHYPDNGYNYLGLRLVLSE
ncbi:MAG: formylglycine-generating enzyme family protein [Bacteroidales bacterium]|nr:formylglycine-generating enzyme family protein [Bacteroidales bacterium]